MQSMPIRPHRRLAPGALVLASIMLRGCHCGLELDYTETFLVTDPVERIVIIVDDGTIDAVSYDRDTILLKRHTFAFENTLETPSYSVEDGVLDSESHCKHNDDICSFDHLLELPFGVGFDITMDNAGIDMGYIDGSITATFNSGHFRGNRLAAPQLEISAPSAEIDAEFAAVPESVMIDLDRGDVSLQLPAGEYQCRLDSTNGEVTVEGDGIVCNDAATAVLDVHLRVGDILVTEAAP
jgi:hypothetical protein